MKKRSDQFHNDPWDRDYYGTGSTQPPKNHGGIIAVLLIAVIILGSITTCLGILNIRLFRMLELQSQTEENMQLLQPQETTYSTISPETEVTTGGAGMLSIHCTTVTDFDTRFYSLPYGCLVTGLVEDGGADRAGLCTGDVIVCINGNAVTNVEDLAAALAQHHAGEKVTLSVYRSRTEQELTLDVILDEKGENE